VPSARTYREGMRSLDTESLADEEINDLAVRSVRAIRAECAGVSWGRAKRHRLPRLFPAASSLADRRRRAGGRARRWAVLVRSVRVFEVAPPIPHDSPGAGAHHPSLSLPTRRAARHVSLVATVSACVAGRTVWPRASRGSALLRSWGCATRRSPNAQSGTQKLPASRQHCDFVGHAPGDQPSEM